MERVSLSVILSTASIPGFAHEGHGVDGGALFHYLSGAHLFLPLTIALCTAAATYFALRYLRDRD